MVSLVCKKVGVLSLLLFLLFLSTSLYSQNLGRLEGFVKDVKTGDPLIGATVRVIGTELGSVTDERGYFLIENIPTQSYTVEARFLGFKSELKYNVIVRSAGNVPLVFELLEALDELGEVVVTASPFIKKAEAPNSIQNLSREEIATYPGGNNDIAKVVQSLPGVSGSVGFRNDVIIRGGAPSENVYYLDGVEIPNINHFATQGSAGGPVGLLNVSFIEDVTLSTSAFGAQYDNALSGVLQFNQRTGNPKRPGYNFRLGASEAAFTFEGPLSKSKNSDLARTTYIVSARRSYLQFLFKLIDLPFLPDYWDYQYKINHKIDDKNELNLIGIGSIDDFSVNRPDDITEEQQAILDQISIIQQRTNTIGLSWKSRFNNGFLRTTISNNFLTNKFQRFRDNENKQGLLFGNDATEIETKFRFEWTKFVNSWTFSAGTLFQTSSYENETDDLENNISFSSDLNFERYGLFGQIAKSSSDEKLVASLGFRLDGDSFSEGGSNIFNNFSPRFSISYALSNRWTVNGSAGIYYKIPPMTILGFQDNSGVFVNQSAKYIRSDHMVLGLEFIPKQATRFTLEGFYKRYDNYPVSVRNGVSLANLGGDFEVFGSEEIISNGKGRAYGMEFLYQQKLTNRFYGILAYTLFWSEYTDVSRAVFRPALWDNRHLLTFTGGYKLNNNWELGIRTRYLGRAPFIPVDVAATELVYPTIVNDFSRIGDERLQAFNSTDIRIDKKWNYKNWSLNVFFEVTNILGSDLPQPPQYGLDLDDNGLVILPQMLIRIEEENNSATIPTFGVVIDF